jgi:Immunoglobulin-like domain of bacterial spore germination
MTDDRLLERLAQLDPATPDRIADASSGADELRRGITHNDVDELAPRRLRWRRLTAAIAHGQLTAAAVALLVFAASGIFAWRAFAPIDRVNARASVTPTGDPLGSLPRGWTELPSPPQVASGSSALWVGSELIDWGGSTYDEASDTSSWFKSGFAFDPVSRTWRSIPDAPAPRADALPLWTGREALFLWGTDRSGDRTDGLAFDPATAAWRSIPAAPVEPRSGAFAVWTGSEAIVWGGGDPSSGTENTGAAYDPSTDTWRRIADSPIGLNQASIVWTGNEVVVFGSLLDRGNHATTSTAVGAAYDPASDRWRELPPSDLSPQATTAAWIGGRLVAWDVGVRSQEYDPSADRWSSPASMPLDSGECYPDSVTLRTIVLGWYCGDAVSFDASAGGWTRLRGGPLDETIDAYGRPYQLWRFATLVPAGDVAFIEAEGITVGPRGVPCYGCDGSPHSMWAFRPGEPSTAATSEPKPSTPAPLGPIEMTEPVRGATVTSPITISGTADVFEATVSIRIIDANNNTLAETVTAATCGTGCRGDFTIDVPFSVNTEQPGVIQVFEVSAKDGSMINIVRIPVTLAPEDPVADAVEGVWRDANGDPVPDGRPVTEPLVLDTFEGAEHCGWTSVTFMTMGWPPGSEATGPGTYRQYYRDPSGVLSPSSTGSFAPNAALPTDAASTGFHRHGWQLWVAPSDSAEAVYVVNGDPATGAVVERWPRAVVPIGCD